MKRTMDGTRLTEIANHPSVRPMLGGGDGALDIQLVLESPRNIAFADDAGGFVFIDNGAGRYELHTLLMPEGRGARVLPAFARAARYMFVETDCSEIVTKVPDDNPAAGLMARRAGFSEIFRREDAWKVGVGIAYFSMTLDQWVMRDRTVAKAGHAFHGMLESAKATTASDLPVHPDDDAHDRAAGMAALMAKASNAAKGVTFYNRWASFAGYQTIDLINETPAVIDVRDAVITVRSGELEVLLCR